MVLPLCKEAAFLSFPSCAVLTQSGVSDEAGPDADRSGANPTELDPSSQPRSCPWVCPGCFAPFQEMLVVGLDGFGLMSSPGALPLAGEKQPDPHFLVSDQCPS